MAFLSQEDDELQGQGQNGAQSPLVGGGSAQVGGGAGSGGIGKGGQGGWTNIQAYLGANTGNTGGSALLDKTASDQFAKEKTDMTSAANTYVSDAQKQVDQAKISNEQADDLINKQGQEYNWGGQQSLGYQQNVDKVKGALNGQYQGPTSYQYSLGADTQNVGNALKDDQAFNNYMGDVYAKASGKTLSTGQRALQNQLDVNNNDLSNARQRALGQYAELGDLRDKTVKSATDQLGGLEQQYRTNQNALRDYLTGKSNTYDTEIGQAEAAARAAYNQAANTGSGLKSLGYDTIAGIKGNNAEIGPRAQLGVWGDNLNYNQLQNELNAFNSGQLKWMTPDRDPDLANKQNVLNNFYAQQDAAYANTADEQERKYNALADFLGLGSKREQGFRVRG